jgi:hypothetical protein
MLARTILTPWRTSAQIRPGASLRWVLFVTLFVTSACAQDLRFGLKVGVPFTPYFDTSAGISSSATRRYAVGPSVGPALPHGFSLELDALYRRMGYSVDVSSGKLLFGGDTRDVLEVKGNSWDFPLVVKHQFGPSQRFYASGGAALRYISSARGIGTRSLTTIGESNLDTTITPIDTAEPTELRKRSYPGITTSAGVDLRRGRPHIGLELRYTRWTSNIGASYLHFAPDQLEFLFGVSFESRR